MKNGEKYENPHLNDITFSIKYSNIPKLAENNILSNFEIDNKEEIINFIIKNIGLMEYMEKVTPIINTHFPEDNFRLEFEKDPEIPNFNKIVIYIKREDESFDADWKEIKNVNEEIKKISINDDSLKNLLFVDLW